MHRQFPLLLLALISTLLAGRDNGVSVSDPNALRFKEAFAARIHTPPIIDGILDDEIWLEAQIVDEFLQVDPYDLAAPSEKTEVRIVYDDENLYISFRNYDRQPALIKQRLTRRDDWMGGFENNSDWVGIGLDTRNDDLNGYWFAVNAAGAIVDVYISKDGNFDSSWDAVWDWATSIDEKGWTAEIQIPFSVFQFSSDPEQVWGAEFMRGIYRLQEKTQWPGRAKGAQGVVSRFGVLKGLQNIPPPKQFEILPYILSGRTDTGEIDYSRNLGLDMEYGLTSNTTMNMAFNPDFGQVEVDPSVLNLTAFETFYAEKRPFFVEGGGFFQNRIQLFHSRRIGKRPGYFSPSEGEIIDRPEATTILGAMKIIGQTESGLSFGLIESVTDREYGIWEYTVEDSMVREKYLLEPYSNHFIGRVEQTIINDISTVGAMVTNLDRQGGEGATVFGVDWNLKFMDNTLSFRGQAARSSKNGSTGNVFRFSAGYQDPKWWELNAGGGIIDDRFEINDLGFMQRNNTWWAGIRGELRKQDPWGQFLRNDLNFRYSWRGRGDGLILSKSLNLNQDNTLNNYWSFGFGANISFSAFSDEDVFKDERAWDYKTETSGYGFAWVKSDRRKRVILQPSLGIGKGEIRGWGYRIGLDLTLKPTDNINVSIDAIRDLSPESMQWVGVVEDSAGANIIYAKSRQIIDDIKIRLNWTFTPDLSMELFLQPFRVDMDFQTFYRLVAPRTYDLQPYAYNGDPDFKINNRVGTFVLRWEYLPGSTIYLVYNLNDNRYYSGSDGAWEKLKANSLFIKLNYWIQA